MGSEGFSNLNNAVVQMPLCGLCSEEALVSLCKQQLELCLSTSSSEWYLQSSCSLSQYLVYQEHFVPSPYSATLLFLCQGQFTLLRDTRTDGSFLVHHFLSFYLRGGSEQHAEAGAPWSFPQGSFAEGEVPLDKHKALRLGLMDPSPDLFLGLLSILGYIP